MSSTRLRRTLVLLLLALAAKSTQAQHLDVLLQVVDGRIVTGGANYDTNTWLVGQKVYKRQFLSNFRTNDPGFTSLESGNPLLESGVMGFAPQLDVLVDIVPSVVNGQRANFWYWDGADLPEDGFSAEDVAFAAAPPGVTWNLFDDDFQQYTADGSDTVVPNALVQTTFSSDGGLHNHLLMQIAAGGEGTPPEGIYLASLAAHAEGLEPAEPLFFVHRTSQLTNEPRDVAAEWVQRNYDFLVGSRLQGDYNLSGSVDGADLVQWQREFGSVASPQGSGADGYVDGFVDAADLSVWLNSFGAETTLDPNTVVSVPEPALRSLLGLGGIWLLAARRQQTSFESLVLSSVTRESLSTLEDIS